MSVAALVIIVMLSLSELSIFLKKETVDHLVVDQGTEPKMRIDFDVTFPRIPCSRMYSFLLSSFIFFILFVCLFVCLLSHRFFDPLRYPFSFIGLFSISRYIFVVPLLLLIRNF